MTVQGNAYQKTLELMLDLEKKIEIRVKDVQNELLVAQDNILKDVERRQRVNTEIEQRLASIEYKVQTDLELKVKRAVNQVDETIAESRSRETQVVQTAAELDKLQSSQREYFELIEALDEKTNVANDAVKDTRNVLYRKISLLEKSILEKLDDGKNGNISIQFKAYEDTITRLEKEVDGLQKDFILMRDRTTKEVKSGIDTIELTRDDYVTRINGLYEELKQVMNVSSDTNSRFSDFFRGELAKNQD